MYSPYTAYGSPVAVLTGGKGGYRAHILWFFRPVLRPRKLLSHTEKKGKEQDAKEKIVGFEPTTFCLKDKRSTNELNIFLKEKIAVCVFE